MLLKSSRLALPVCVFAASFASASYAQDDFWAGGAVSADMAPLEAAYERATSAVDGDEIRTLLRLGVSVDHRDDAGRTALWYAARAGETKLIAELLADGADASLSDRDGVSALHLVSTAGASLAAADQLVSYGADINAQDHTGATPLLVAMRANADLIWAEWFLARGADPFIPDASGDRAASLVRTRLNEAPTTAESSAPQAAQDRSLLRSTLSLGVAAYAGTEAGLVTDIVADVALGDRGQGGSGSSASGASREAPVRTRVAWLLAAAEAGCGSPGASIEECPAGRPVTAATLRALEIPDTEGATDWGFAP